MKELENKTALLQSIAFIDEFIKSLKGGDSFWIDPKGGHHTTDVGYGIEFWNQIKEYLESEL